MISERLTLVSTILRVSDIAAAARWYRQHLGVDVEVAADGEHPIATFALGNAIVSLWQLAPDEDQPRGSTSDPYLVLVVDRDLDELRNELLGARVPVTPVSEQSRLTRFFRLTDPDCNVIEVAEVRAT